MTARAVVSESQSYVGRALPRLEDPALLTGQARFGDDLPMAPGLLHAAILRSPHAHAEILSIDMQTARGMAGVTRVLTGEDVRSLSEPFLVALRTPIEHRCLAVDRVRYVGEPVAIVLAEDRYIAEDAAHAIDVEYRTLVPTTSIQAGIDGSTPPLHADVGTNLVSERKFVYGDPDSAFATADRTVEIEVLYPRNACTPIENFFVQAAYDGAEDSFDIVSNFSGPFAVHPVVARALKVPMGRLRFRTPPCSGGSFGVKQAIFPYIALMGVAARACGRPVRWVEDRLEHLVAATSATSRRTSIRAAVREDGRILGLDIAQTEDCGAYLRAPEPASLYRNHGNLTGAYDVAHLAVTNRIVVTNKTPSGLNRGFGGPQLYFALETLMRCVARELDLDPLDVIRKNLVASAAMPYKTASGGRLDGGDYAAAIERAVTEGGLEALKERRRAARAEGRIYGIGYACVVEPSISNMGYVTTVLSPEERTRAGPKNGAQATATISLDPQGGVQVSVASLPQGQGHRTVLAQVVADILGLTPQQIVVNTDLDTAKDAWSIASGNYSSRFAGAVAGTAQIAATRLRERLANAAASLLNTRTENLRFAEGRVSDTANPENDLSFARLAATAHWAPGTLKDEDAHVLRETAFWTPLQLSAPNEKDEINSSAAYGFIFDFCGVELDPVSGQVSIDKYVTMHDAGRLLNPLLANGQIYGGFAHGVGAALYEELRYSRDGDFLAGTLADYLVPTAREIPEPLILHAESDSSATPSGAKGIGEGNTMSTPVCLANAVADALGTDLVPLPMTPNRIAEVLHGDESPRPCDTETRGSGARRDYAPDIDGLVSGFGELDLDADPQTVWDLLLDPAELAQLLPHCDVLERIDDQQYRGEVTLRIGPIRSRYRVDIQLSDLNAPHGLTLHGRGSGALGSGRGAGRMELAPTETGTRLAYDYRIDVGGKVASVGARMLNGAARMVVDEFFNRLARRLGPEVQPETSLIGRLWAQFGNFQ